VARGQGCPQGFYINGIKLLYKTYKIFYAEEETEEMVLEQWEDLKVEINVPSCRRNNCLNTCLNTCFPVSTLGVLTPVLVSQHLILNAKKCLNVKPTPLPERLPMQMGGTNLGLLCWVRLLTPRLIPAARRRRNEYGIA
jgi:hypothetical protein